MKKSNVDILRSTLKELLEKHPRPQKIKIKDIENGKIKLNELNRFIHRKLSDDIFLIPDKKIIIFHSLKGCFYFKNINLDNQLSIEDRCRKILKALGIFSENENVLDSYFCKVLRLAELPYLERIELEKKAKDDLKAIDKLICNYEKEKCVMVFKVEKQNPRNQTERIFIDFYKRCINEKEKIVNFLINDIDEKAINLCTDDAKKYFYHSIRKPYTFEKGKIEFYDCDKIDKCEHKFSRKVEYKEKQKLKHLYSNKNYGKFYFKLKKYLSFKKVFANIFEKISEIPKLKDRLDIVCELEVLFKNKKWYGFYALVLTQIEGIFSEMIDVIYEEKKRLFSLPDKVDALREYCWTYKHSFDYFQYYLPIQRNKFMHFGLENNLKYESYGLLYDLNSVLNIFYELDTPYVELINIVERKDREDFECIEDFNRFYELIQKVSCKKNQIDGEKINNFINDFILKNVDFEMIIFVVFRDLKIKFSEFFNRLQIIYKEEVNSPINILGSQNKILMKKLSIFKEIYEHNKYSLKDDLKYIYEVDRFIKGTRKNIKTLSDDIIFLLDQIDKKYNVHFEKFNLIIHNLGMDIKETLF